jgi:hypothetical protein
MTLVRKLAWLSLAGTCFAGAAPSFAPPRSPADITKMLALGPHAGDCTPCHSMHAEGQAIAYPFALIGPPLFIRKSK